MEGALVLSQRNQEAKSMPADEIGEALFRVVFRGVIYFVVEILWWIVCFYVGLPIVKIATLGRYPEETPSPSQEIITSAVGFLLLLFGIMWLTGFLR